MWKLGCRVSLAIGLLAASGHFSQIAHAEQGSRTKEGSQPTSLADCSALLSGLTFAQNGLAIASFPQPAIDHVLKERLKLKLAFGILSREFLGAENYILGLMTAQIAGYNTLLYGGPGAAKTGIIHRLNPNIWIKQLSEQTTPLALLGGQRLKGASDGVEDINLDRSMVRSEFANLDEVDKAQPELLTMLLSLLNPGERWVTIAGEKIHAQTRSVHFTSNLPMAKLLERFFATGMTGSGLALLNRLQVKMMLPNWLEQHLMLEMLRSRNQRDRLAALAKVSPQAQAALAATTMPEDIDWRGLFWLSEAMFAMNSQAEVHLNDFVHNFRREIVREIKSSQGEGSAYSDVAPFAPTAEMTTRLVGELPRMIRASALLDLLLTDLSDDQIRAVLSQPVQLSSLSNWRTIWMLTSIGPGLSRLNPDTLEIELNLMNHPDGTFKPMDTAFLSNLARDKTELLDIQFFVKEQTLWLNLVTSLLASEREVAKKVARVLPESLQQVDFNKIDFEALVARARR